MAGAVSSISSRTSDLIKSLTSQKNKAVSKQIHSNVARLRLWWNRIKLNRIRFLKKCNWILRNGGPATEWCRWFCYLPPPTICQFRYSHATQHQQTPALDVATRRRGETTSKNFHAAPLTWFVFSGRRNFSTFLSFWCNVAVVFFCFIPQVPRWDLCCIFSPFQRFDGAPPFVVVHQFILN